MRRQALHDARTHTLDQHVGAFVQVQPGIAGRRVLEVEDQRLLAAIDDCVLAKVEHMGAFATGTLQQNHFRAHVGQQHAEERPWPDPGEFDDPNANSQAIAPSFEMYGPATGSSTGERPRQATATHRG